MVVPMVPNHLHHLILLLSLQFQAPQTPRQTLKRPDLQQHLLKKHRHLRMVRDCQVDQSGEDSKQGGGEMAAIETPPLKRPLFED